MCLGIRFGLLDVVQGGVVPMREALRLASDSLSGILWNVIECFPVLEPSLE